MAISPSNTQWLRIFLILSFFPEFRSCNYHHRCCSLRNLEMNTNCNNSSSLLNLTSHMRSLLTLNNHHCLLFLTFSIIEILGQIVSFWLQGHLVCSTLLLPAFLGSTHQVSVASPTPPDLVTTKTVSRRCQMFPEGQNVPWLSTTPQAQIYGQVLYPYQAHMTTF